MSEIGTGERRHAFWTRVYATHPPAILDRRPAVRLTYTHRALGDGPLCLYAGFSATELTHSVRAYPFDLFPDLAARLEPHLPAFETLLGTREIDPRPKAPHALIRRRPFDFTDEAQWPEAVAWIAGCDATTLAALAAHDIRMEPA